MLNVGIKTQSSLAEHIALDEKLETAPKDTVNRAFRQESVSPTTIARIAKILKVEAYTLYLSKQENDFVKNNEVAATELSVSRRFFDRATSLKLFLIPSLVAIFVIIFLMFTSGPSVLEANEIPSEMPVSLGKYSIAVISISDNTNLFANAVLANLQKNFNSTKISMPLITSEKNSADIAQDYQADGLLSIKQTVLGRFIGIQVYFYINGTDTLIWTGSYLNVELAQNYRHIAQQFMPYFNFALNKRLAATNSPYKFADIAIQKKYLQARNLLDNAESELNVKRAQGLLHSALQSYPGFANAVVAQCESLIEESWKGNEKTLLEDAQRECDRALILAPDNTYAQATLAYLFRRTGRLEKSIDLYNDILKNWPNNLYAVSGISSAYLEAYRQNLNAYPNAMEEMLVYAKKATQLEPKFWKHHSAFGLLSYFAGNPELAASAFGIAAELNPNELAFTNVGTINKCIGDIDKAEYYYRKAIEIAPDSYLGKEFLGGIYFYKEDFKSSIELKKQALDSFSENDSRGIHQMWGALGHAYRKNAQTDKAIESYLTALKILKRDTLRGNIAVADKIFGHYYKLLLTRLAPSIYTEKSFELDISEIKALLAQDTDSAAYAALAHSLLLHNNIKLANKALQKATSICPVYRLHPDLKQLAQTN